jgi:hypothetical protein
MTRGIIVLFLGIIAMFLILAMSNKYVNAQDPEELGQVLKNQKVILEKLDAIDKKLDVIKMRIRL